MTQLTVRGFDKPLEQRIRQHARRKGVSLNKAALDLLRRGAGLAPDSHGDTVGDSLDRFAGTWTREQARAFERAVSVMDRVDPGLWR